MEKTAQKRFYESIQNSNGEYELLENNIYNNHIKIKHNICGTEWNVNIHHWNNGSRCKNKYCKIEKRVKTNLEKFGVEYPMKLESVKKNISEKNKTKTQQRIQKSRKTKLEKYGNEKYTNMEKHKETILKKYGVENVSKIPEVRLKKKLIWKNKEKEEQTSIIEIGLKEKFKNYFNNNILKFEHCTPLFDYEEYIGTKKNKYKFKCNICSYEFYDSVSNGRIPICRKCYPTFTSSGELEIQEFLKDLNINFISGEYWNSHKYQLDLYLKEYNFGIEYNGVYWHSELNGRYKNYHLHKTNYFKSQNIEIIHIFENEWITKKEIVKSIIKSKLNLNERIFARKCEIKTVDSKISSKFLDNNHLQGNINSSVKLGLYYNNELIALLTLGKSRYNKNYDWEILRYCSKLNTNIVGGFSKLLKYFIRNYNPKNIITYADRRYSNGNVYLKNRFQLINTSEPNYFYFKKRDVLNLYSRIKFQKHKLKRILNIFNSELTEWENMQLNGYDRIWDCGNYVFELRI